VPLFCGAERFAVIPRGHPAEEIPSVTPADVRDETLITFPRAMNPSLHDRQNDDLTAACYRFAGLHEAAGGDRRDIMVAVAEGRGVAFLPGTVLDEEVTATVVLRPADPPVRMPAAVLA
jgi:DNA-binding transcriptional LysR family regulator